MNCSTPDFPVHHQLPELAQTRVRQVRDALQPYYLLSSPSSPAFNLSQHQGLSEWISSLHQVANVLELQLQHHPSNEYSWLISFRIDWFIFLQSKGLSRIFPSNTILKHQFFGTQPSLRSNSHIGTWLLEKPKFWLNGPLLAKWYLCFVICCLSLS